MPDKNYPLPTKAVITAAGLGTRMLPISKSVPKEMLPIVDKPAIAYLVEEAVNAGITDILIITNRDKDIIEDYFDYSPEYENQFRLKPNPLRSAAIAQPAELANIYFIRQKVTKGLGHAVGCARSFVGDEPFIVMYGDDIIFSQTPVTKQLMDVYAHWGKQVAGVKAVTDEQIMSYCSLKVNEIEQGIFDVSDMIEKPKTREEIFSNYSVLGRVLLTPEIFDIIDSTPPGANNEIQLTDAMKTAAVSGNMMALDYEGTRYDMGSKLGFLMANVERGVLNEEFGAEFRNFLKQFAEKL